MELRYGINPGSTATLTPTGSTMPFRVLAGQPSYVNVLDALNAWQLVRALKEHTGLAAATSFKHVSPAGAAVAGSLDDTMRATWGADNPGPATSAYIRARDADPRASYGDLIAVSESVDEELASFLVGVISDGIIAPAYEPGVVDRLARKKSGSYLMLEAAETHHDLQEGREVAGARLLQHRNVDEIVASLPALADLTEPQRIDAIVGVATVRYTQSNSVGLFAHGMTLGVSAGQQSRVDSTRLAGGKASTWWLRRHPWCAHLRFAGSVRRQERLAWTTRLLEGDLTPAEEEAARDLLEAPFELLSAEAKAEWMQQLRGVTLVSDGLIPFTDNIDHAARYGVSTVIEPGRSARSDLVSEACESYGLRHLQTGQRLFHH